MAGHSKWANIKFRKSVQDAKRGKVFTKYIREITISARISSDPQSNPRLRAAIDKALAANMTRDTIDRAIKRGAGGQEGQDLEEIRYEGYAPGGIAIIVDCMTNNRNRTVSEVRHAFTKAGGNLGTEGSVSYLFIHRGQIIFAPGSNEEKIMEVAIEAGALEVESDEEGAVIVTTSYEDFSRIKQAMEKEKLAPVHAETSMLPVNTIYLSDKETAEKFNKLIDTLEDLDDVQEVYSNGEIEESVLADLG